MCGIVYVKRTDDVPAHKSVLKRYQHQKARGQEGFGYIAIKNNKVVSYQRAESEHDILEKLAKEDAPEILFHHRYPTSTPNIEESAHPLIVEGGGLKNVHFIVHNGVIRNTNALKVEHEKMGFVYKTEIQNMFQTYMKKSFHLDTDWNDSESIAIETALAVEGLKKTIDAEGFAAVIGIEVEKKTGKVISRYAFRNLNPLAHRKLNDFMEMTSIGKGDNMPKAKLMSIMPDGTLKEHKNNVETPIGYKPPGYNTTPYKHDYDPVDPPSHERYLPRGNTDVDLEPSEEDINYAESLGLTGGGIDIEDTPKQKPLFETIGTVLKNHNLPNIIKNMEEADMWNEYEKCRTTMENISFEILQIDNLVESGESVIDRHMFYERKILDRKLNKVEEYMKMLDAALLEKLGTADGVSKLTTIMG